MHRHTLAALACPACRVALHQPEHALDHTPLIHGILTCPQCAIWVPVVQGFALFSEAMPAGTPDLDARLTALHAHMSGGTDYAQFVHNRHARRIPDSYAAFQPFNESTRAVYALFDLIRATLKPGDLILDTWGRTGWSGEMLAAAFPQQHVISVWEGNFDVLGHAGYAFWLKHGERAPNHDIVFANPSAGLPFLDGRFAFVHGLDSLHRYNPLTFGGDILRIARADGVISFPHVHLANSEPQPFFERGGWKSLGRAHQQRFELAKGRAGRSVIVASEARLFDAQGTLHTEPDNPHYNGLVALVPPAWDGAPLRTADLDICLPEARAVLNPLLRIDTVRGMALIDAQALGGLIDDLLVRHPCYTDRLARLNPQALDTTELQILFHLGQLRTLGETAQRLDLPFAQVAEHCARLVKRELIQVAPLSRAMSRLQAYYADQIVRPLAQQETFAYLWQLAPTLYGARPMLVAGADDSVFGWDEASMLVAAMRRGLDELGVRAGDRVAMLSGPHPVATLMCWAIWLNGSVVVPLRKELCDTPSALSSLLDHIEPALLLLDGARAGAAALARCATLLLDDPLDDAAAVAPLLSDTLGDWLDLPAVDEVHAKPVHPDDAAVILFTSGSTGMPKGVVLSQRALLQSGQLAATQFGWHHTDTLLSLADMHTMSGLRNPCVAALFAGATVYLPEDAERLNVGKTLQACAARRVTVLATGPAWLAMLNALPDHLLQHPATLRQIASTGATLQSSLHDAVARRMGVSIIDYYGLTETGGLCLVFDHAGASAQTIVSGRAVGALMQVCDAAGQPVVSGQPGQLRVHSNQLLQAYWRNPQQTATMLRDGWVYTGDLASYDEHGRITLLGRADDQLKNEFGEIVFPAHLERVMANFPQVSDVAVCAGPRGLITFVAAEQDFALTDFVAYCRQHLASSYVPREVRQLPALPLSPAGKLDRRRLTQLAHAPSESH